MPLPKVIADAIERSRANNQNPYTSTADAVAKITQLTVFSVTRRLKEGKNKFHGVRIRFVRDQAVQGSPYRLHSEDVLRLERKVMGDA